MKDTFAHSTAVNRLKQVQEQMRDIGTPQYDEFHAVTSDLKITIPQKRKAATTASGK